MLLACYQVLPRYVYYMFVLMAAYCRSSHVYPVLCVRMSKTLVAKHQPPTGNSKFIRILLMTEQRKTYLEVYFSHHLFFYHRRVRK
jgi:hypothetical protein